MRLLFPCLLPLTNVRPRVQMAAATPVVVDLWMVYRLTPTGKQTQSEWEEHADAPERAISCVLAGIPAGFTPLELQTATHNILTRNGYTRLTSPTSWHVVDHMSDVVQRCLTAQWLTPARRSKRLADKTAVANT